jgi:hypothetical protein
MTQSKIEDFTQATGRKEIWFESDGTRLFALELGRGAPIVFVHGGLADHEPLCGAWGHWRARIGSCAPICAAAGARFTPAR